MANTSDAYRLATEAGREATKQLIVVTGGLLAGYLAFLGRAGAEEILDVRWAHTVMALLFTSLLMATASLGFTYLMHAARSRRAAQGKSFYGTDVRRMEAASIATGAGAFLLCLGAVATIVVTAIC